MQGTEEILAISILITVTGLIGKKIEIEMLFKSYISKCAICASIKFLKYLSIKIRRAILSFTESKAMSYIYSMLVSNLDSTQERNQYPVDVTTNHLQKKTVVKDYFWRVPM